MTIPQEIQNLINPSELIQLYLDKKYNEITGKFISILRYFRDNTILKLDENSQYFINIFVENLLYFLTMPDYILDYAGTKTLINMNMVISNLVAMTHFKNTDAQIQILMKQPNNYAKILVLYSCRNSIKLDNKVLFDVNVELALQWYLAYFFVGSYVTQLTYDNFISHLNNLDERIAALPYQLHPAYQISSYYGQNLDRKIKRKLNELIKNLYKDVKISNIPDRKKIAVITKRWAPLTSIHRTCYGFVESLKDDYDLTLIHLGEPYKDIDTSLFKEVKNIKFMQDLLNLEPVINNEFSLAYFPDVGLTLESIHLANIRIAPVQIAGYGHPVSTFGSEIDYFIGGQDVECPEFAKENYSERLVLLPGNASPPTYPTYEPKGIQNNSDKFLIACSWGIMKINYPLLCNLKKVIKKSNKKLIFRIFAASGSSRYNGFIPLENEIASIIGRDNFELIANTNYENYMELVEECEIAIDSYPYGGYNTAIDMIYLRKPLVAYEGNKFFNKSAASLLRPLELDELITRNDEDYVNLILKLINDNEFRSDITNRLKQADLNSKIYKAIPVKEFKVMIDFLIENHKKLINDTTKDPIIFDYS